jgi:hypothetical protein
MARALTQKISAVNAQRHVSVRPRISAVGRHLRVSVRVHEPAGDGDDIHERTVAPYRDLEPASVGVLDHGALKCRGRSDRLTGERYDDIADAKTRAGCRTLRHDLRDVKSVLTARLGHHGRRKWHLRPHDPEPRPADPSMGHQRGDDPPGRVVDGHGQPDADAGNRGIDPDHAPRAVRECPAAVARVERGIGLDHLVDDATGAGRQGTSERGDDAGGDTAGEPQRVAQGNDKLADPQLGRVAEWHRRRNRDPAP